MKISLKKTTCLLAILLGTTLSATTIPIYPNFGDVSEVSDLSKGGLRIGGGGENGPQSSEAYSQEFVVQDRAYIAFDWRVIDSTEDAAYSYYDININGQGQGPWTFQDGAGMGVYCGTISHLLDEGVYNLDVGVYVYGPKDSYLLDIWNVRLSDSDVGVSAHRCEVPDSSLGFLGVFSILGVIGLGRRRCVCDA